jgi:hypothetical protein
MTVRKKIRKRSTRPRREWQASKGAEAIKASDRELLGIPKSEWTTAKRKERIVKMALRSGIEAAADVANCSTRTIRRPFRVRQFMGRNTPIGNFIQKVVKS